MIGRFPDAGGIDRRHAKMSRTATIALLLTILVGSAAGCTINRGTEASAVERRVRALPGVADSWLNYSNDFESGEYFRIAITLEPQVTPAQATEIARTFVDEMYRGRLAGRNAGLDLRLGDSQARFAFGPANAREDPDVADVADSVAVWLQAIRSPVAEAGSLTQPAFDGPASSREMWIRLRLAATATETHALQHSNPGLTNATWALQVGLERNPRTHEYTSTPDPPSDHDKELWLRIVDIIGACGQDTTATRPVWDEPERSETKITVHLASGDHCQAGQQRIERELTALLPQFGRPATLELATRGMSVTHTAGP